MFGIPYEWEDIEKSELIWKQSIVRDDNNLTPKRIVLPGEQIKDTAIISNIDFEFTDRIYRIHFYGLMDMLSEIGGLKASLEPLIGLFTPLFIASFLYQLAGVIQFKVGQKQ